MAVAAAGDADVMAELSRVPLGQRHWPWSDRRQAVGADARSARKGAFGYVTLLYLLEMEAAVRVPPVGDFHFYVVHDRKIHTVRTRSALSVATPALHRADRSQRSCRSSVWSRARTTGSPGTSQHGCGAIVVTEALPR